MPVSGADVAQLTKLSTDLGQTWKSQLETTVRTIDTAVQNSQEIWMGKDANQFRTAIWPGHKTALDNAIQVLVEAGQTAKKNADAQETTSSAVA